MNGKIETNRQSQSRGNLKIKSLTKFDHFLRLDPIFYKITETKSIPSWETDGNQPVLTLKNITPGEDQILPVIEPDYPQNAVKKPLKIKNFLKHGSFFTSWEKAARNGFPDTFHYFMISKAWEVRKPLAAFPLFLFGPQITQINTDFIFFATDSHGQAAAQPTQEGISRQLFSSSIKVIQS